MPHDPIKIFRDANRLDELLQAERVGAVVDDAKMRQARGAFANDVREACRECGGDCDKCMVRTSPSTFMLLNFSGSVCEIGEPHTSALRNLREATRRERDAKRMKVDAHLSLFATRGYREDHPDRVAALEDFRKANKLHKDAVMRLSEAQSKAALLP